MTTYVGHNLSDLLKTLSSRAHLDDIAVASNHRGVVGGPTTPFSGELWADSQTGTRLRLRNSANDGWRDIAPLSSNVVPTRFATGVAAPSAYTRVGFTPLAVLLTCEIVHDAGEDQKDTRGVMFHRTTNAGQTVVITLQANDDVLGSTTAAIPGNPRNNRPVLRCTFRDDGFLFTRSGRDDLGENYRYAAFGRGF